MQEIARDFSATASTRKPARTSLGSCPGRSIATSRRTRPARRRPVLLRPRDRPRDLHRARSAARDSAARRPNGDTPWPEFSDLELHARYKGREVWHVPPASGTGATGSTPTSSSRRWTPTRPRNTARPSKTTRTARGRPFMMMTAALLSRSASARPTRRPIKRPSRTAPGRSSALHEADAAELLDLPRRRPQGEARLRREPIYRWTNPTRSNGQEGDVFLWTYQAAAPRPSVASSPTPSRPTAA